MRTSLPSRLRIGLLALILAMVAAATAAQTASAEVQAGYWTYHACYKLAPGEHFEFRIQCKYRTHSNGSDQKGPYCYSRTKLVGQAFIRAGAC